MTASGLVSRASPVHTAVRNCTRDEGRSFEAGSQVQASNHCKLLSSKAMVVSVAVNVGTISRRVRLREASASEPSMKCRKRISLTASQNSLTRVSCDWSGTAWASREGPDKRDKQSSAHGCD